MKNAALLIILLLFAGCKSNDPGIVAKQTDEIIISDNFIGLGTALGGYDNLQSITGSPTLNDADWRQMFNRLDFFRPGIVRIMGSQGWNYSIGGQYNPQKSEYILFKILDYCQSHGIDVIWGEWGHTGGTTIDKTWLGKSVSFLDFLINTRQYSCIKYFNMLNEPNGSWSSNKGDYNLWKELITLTYDSIKAKGLLDKIKIIGPDISINRDGFLGNPVVVNSFVSNTVRDLDVKIGAYDYHLYPGDGKLDNGKFLNTMKAYLNLISKTKPALITELGFSYEPTTDKGLRNIELRNADSFSADNANMMVYESSYGIDISASIIQLMLAGYQSALVWRFDDAQYIDADGKFTRWGFYNSLGAEKCNKPSDENLRPWFYPVSLLTRYFPKNCTILKLNTPDNKVGLYGVSARKDGHYTLALVNVNLSKLSFEISLDGGIDCKKMRKYKFVARQNENFDGSVDSNDYAKEIETNDMDFTLNKVHSFTMEGNSFILLTNMD